MKFRIARHTSDLQPIIGFYCGILDLVILGEFHDHEGYDGVFIGNHGADWHLEFTISKDRPDHNPDQDDLLVFYAESQAEYEHLLERFRLNQIEEVQPKNPYWENHGKTFTDPDGYRIVISKITI